MVQRKVPSKLCLQIDHLKSETWLGKLRPSSPRTQDGKSRGSEMKKKMKKLKSMKQSDIERCLESPDFTEQVPHPGKPPPPIEKQKQSPNYMKSTSSSEARKEQSQVTSQPSVGHRSPIKNSKISKLSPDSGHKSAKTLTRTSSLKKVRALTKAPSFKPTRAANKIVLREDLNSQRSTCSSTLKDYKFPNYLELSRGATESDGTSLVKVCPYTYCSLNSHRHAALPPLKCFLSAKRRMLKTQKSMKMVCLSPRKTDKPALMKEILGEMAEEEKAAIQEQNLKASDIDPGVHEDNMDFYVEIYVKDRGDDFEKGFSCKGKGKEVHHDDGGIVQSFSPNENNLKECTEVFSVKTDSEDKSEAEEINQGEETPETVGNQIKMELKVIDLETDDMEWEQGQLSMNTEVDNPAEGKNGQDSANGSLFSGNDPSFHNGTIFSISWFDGIPVDKGEDEFAHTGDDETESNGTEEEAALIKSVEDWDNPGESRQEEIHENYDYRSSENNHQIFEINNCKEVFVGDILADTKNSATNQTPEHDIMEKRQDGTDEFIIPTSSFDLEGLSEDNQDMKTDDKTGITLDERSIESEKSEVSEDTCMYAETQIHSSHELSEKKNFVEDQIDPDKDTQPEPKKVIIMEEIHSDITEMELSYSDNSDIDESFSAEKELPENQAKTTFTRCKGRLSEDLKENKINLQIIRCKRSKERSEEEKEFNPREPNYLPVNPDPEAEKVDLRHQDLDDRKNAEEWMLDYALQQTVTRLAPARKRKVALLVEAFEKVMPLKYEPCPRQSSPSPAFPPARPIQACS